MTSRSPIATSTGTITAAASGAIEPGVRHSRATCAGIANEPQGGHSVVTCVAVVLLVSHKTLTIERAIRHGFVLHCWIPPSSQSSEVSAKTLYFWIAFEKALRKRLKNVRGSQTKFYIQWKQQMISVQCSSVGPY
jgi:hypothetical protein